LRRYLQLGISFAITLAALTVAIGEVDIDALLAGAARVDPLWGLVGLACLAVNLLVVSFRLRRLMAGLNTACSMTVALRANIAGALAGFFMFQMLGTLVGRYHVLRQSGAPAGVTTSVTYYEKLGVFLIAGTFCLIGAMVVDGGAIVEDALRTVPVLEMATAIGLCVAAYLIAARTSLERSILSALRSARFLSGLAELFSISAAALLLNYLAFVSALWAFGAQTPTHQLLAGAAIVSFAASLPISANGWGVREIAAIQVFGVFGVPPEVALLVSVFVGLGSMAVILAGSFLFPVAVSASDRTAHAPQDSSRDTGMASNLECVLAWALAHGVCLLLFFQIQIPIRGSLTTLNLADPLALLALFALVLSMWSRRSTALFRMPHAGLWLAAIAGVIVLGFFLGVASFGVTPWALTNRLFGLVVLSGYIAAGAYIVTTCGWPGVRRCAESLLVTAAIVVSIQLVFSAANSMGASFNIPSNFDGFSGNRNALAFLLLIAVAGGLVVSSNLQKGGKEVLWALLLGVVLFGIWYSKGRTAVISGAVMVGAAFVFALCSRRVAALSVGFAVLGTFAFGILTNAVRWLLGFFSISVEVKEAISVSSPPLAQSGDSERMLSVVEGFNMWLANPIFGSGLGAFIRMGLGENGKALVIHSTPVWILAELGIVGGLVILGFFLRAGSYPLRRWSTPKTSADRWLLLMMVMYGLFFLPHDIFYQRAFWFVLGLTLAAPMIFRRTPGPSSQ